MGEKERVQLFSMKDNKERARPPPPFFSLVPVLEKVIII